MFLLQLPIWSYIVVGAAELAIVVGLTAERRNRQERPEAARQSRVAAGILRVLTDEGVKRAVGLSADDRRESQ